MARRPQYIPDPATANQPLSLEELETLASQGGNPLKDERAYAHFMSRVHASLRAFQAEYNRLHRQVSQMGIRQTQTGAPSTLSPRDAVRFLPPDELAQLVEGHLRSQVAMVGRLAREVGEQRAEAVAQVNRVKYLLLSLVEDTELDERTRARLSRVYRALPDDDSLRARQDDLSERLRTYFDTDEAAIFKNAPEHHTPGPAGEASPPVAASPTGLPMSMPAGQASASAAVNVAPGASIDVPSVPGDSLPRAAHQYPGAGVLDASPMTPPGPVLGIHTGPLTGARVDSQSSVVGPLSADTTSGTAGDGVSLDVFGDLFDEGDPAVSGGRA